jgi:hypothetical protein
LEALVLDKAAFLEQCAPPVPAPPSEPHVNDDIARLPAACAIRCNDEAFRDWIIHNNVDACHVVLPEHRRDFVVEIVRRHCKIVSRAELSANRDAANRWYALVAEYEAARVSAVFTRRAS